jgi:hypothetical protein
MVLLHSLNERLIGFMSYIDIGEIVPLSNVFVVVDDRAVDNRHYTVLLKDGVIICVSNPDMTVIVDTVQVVPVDDDGSLEVSVSVYLKIQICSVDILGNDCARSPAPVAVIGFTGT